jgi:menaquinone-dependent protoporphyrinogen IX oxidase
MQNIVYYYSNTGNNQFIAKKIAQKLDCKCEEIKPIPNSFFLLLIMTSLGIGSGIKSLKTDPTKYQKVVVCSPIWLGSLVAPIKGFLKKYHKGVSNFVYLTVCGSNKEDNNSKFGHKSAHQKANKVAKGKISHSQALSLKLIENETDIPEEEAMMGIRLSEKLFTDKFKKSFDKFIKQEFETNSNSTRSD